MYKHMFLHGCSGFELRSSYMCSKCHLPSPLDGSSSKVLYPYQRESRHKWRTRTHRRSRACQGGKLQKKCILPTPWLWASDLREKVNCCCVSPQPMAFHCGGPGKPTEQASRDRKPTSRKLEAVTPADVIPQQAWLRLQANRLTDSCSSVAALPAALCRVLNTPAYFQNKTKQKPITPLIVGPV